ncbi:MAG: nucleoside phosphorylase [Bacteroidetes bacterium]|nr:nucleoside phosphorylase [Bacteroidota bacterium]
MPRIIPTAELVLNPDGSVYHLALHPEDISDVIILVGDPGRVQTVSENFSEVIVRKQNREFITHTGFYNRKKISVLSTGIGTDNIDIVLNELDALVNVDLAARKVKHERKKLKLIRIGTSGALQEDIPVDSFIVSTHGLGFDNLSFFYPFRTTLPESTIMNRLKKYLGKKYFFPSLYLTQAPGNLIKAVGKGMSAGITATAPGFYGAQGRMIRIKPSYPVLTEKLSGFRYGNHRIVNFEMETSALYALSRLLGHEACTVCAVVANRVRGEYSRDYHPVIKKLVRMVLERTF